MSTGATERELKLALGQIDQALKGVDACLGYRTRSTYDETDEKDMSAALAAAHCIQRWGGLLPIYQHSAKDVRELSEKAGYAAVKLAHSTLTTLRDELSSGGLANVGLRIRAATNDDLLSHAEELHQAGYREAAAVVAGCALEIHVRRMLATAEIASGKFDSNVTELQQAGVIDRNEAKIIRGAYGLRNAAAHGEALPEAKGTIANMIASIRGFLSHHAA